MMRPSTKVLAATLLVSPWLASCGSAPTRFFSLQSIPPATVIDRYNGPPVRVEAVHVPPALDRSEIVSDLANGELKVDDQYHWSAPVAQLVRQTLTVDLFSRLPSGGVLFPHLSRVEPAIGLSVDILAFSADRNGGRLEASWILNSTAGGVARPKSAVLRTQEPSIGSAATARALSVLLAQLADRIVTDLTTPIPD